MKIFFLLLLAGFSFCLGSWTLESWDEKNCVLQWTKPAALEGLGFSHRAVMGVPPGSGLKAVPEVLESVSYRGSPPGAAVLPQSLKARAGGRYRDTELGILEFSSLIQDENGLREVLRLRLKVEFTRSSGAPAAGLRSSFARPENEAPEQYLRGLLVNYLQSRMFRSVLREPEAMRKMSVSQALPAQRLTVKTQGERIYVLTYEALLQAGVPLGSIDPREMRLFYGAAEQPLFVEGEDDGRWDPGDFLEFIGRRPSGSPMEGGLRSYHSFYTRQAVMALVWKGGVRGMRAPLTPASAPDAGVFDAVRDSVRKAEYFLTKVHVEEDELIIRLGGSAVSEVLDLGSSIERVGVRDFWMWKRQGTGSDAVDINFHLENRPAVLPTGSSLQKLRIKIRMYGITDVLSAPYDHHVRFLVNDFDISTVKGSDNTAKWAGDEPFLWESESLDPSILRLGENILTIQKIDDLTTTAGASVENQDAYLDYIELSYLSDYRVTGDNIRFYSDQPFRAGRVNTELTGLEADQFSLWDIQGRKLTGFGVKNTGKTKTLTFMDERVSETSYLLTSLENRTVPEIQLDTLDDLPNNTQQADYLIITGKSLLGSALDSLIRHREAGGLRCRVVLAEHIYSHFGDGSLNPESIRDFIRYAYEHWPRPAPGMVLLLGETSMWFEKQTGAFQQNIVPTHLIHIPGWGVTSNDDYFVKVSGSDDIADLFIGRIPVASRSDLSRVVSKILVHESRDPGHWKNRVLLLGGFEKVFTATNKILQGIAAAHGRQYTRLDMETSSPYYAGDAEVYPQLDSAMQIVSFAGHGGGSVWSDRNVLTLEALDKDSLKGRDAIPMVFSMTCLTGFFEDIAARSLGEEMVRHPVSGAVSFYGASGYISNAAGRLLAAALYEAALTDGPKSAGSIISAAETMVALQTGDVFSPVLGEFDLLGDPAMVMDFPQAVSGLALEDSVSGKKFFITVKGTDISPRSGECMQTIFLDDSVIAETPFTYSGGKFTRRVQLSAADGAQPFFSQGKAVAHCWNGSRTSVHTGQFSLLDWLIPSIAALPEPFSLGDKIRVRFRLRNLGGSISFTGGSLAWAAGDAPPLAFPEGQEALLEPAGGNLFQTVSDIEVKAQGSSPVRPRLYVRVRMSVTSGGKAYQVESGLFTLDIRTPSDLAFSGRPFRVPVRNKLGTWVRFKNKGLGPDSAFQVFLRKGDNPAGTADTVTYEKQLGPNQVDSVFFGLTEKDLKLSLHAGLHSVLLNEDNVSNNQADTQFTFRTRLLDETGDVIRAPGGASLAYGSGLSVRVFWDGANEYAVPPHLTRALDPQGIPAVYSILSDTLRTGSLVLKHSEDSLSPPGAVWHYYLEDARNWLKLDSVGGGFPGQITAGYFGPGTYGLFVNADSADPRIELTARGQVLLQDDFIPRGAPVQITLRDDAGIDFRLHVPSVVPLTGTYQAAQFRIQSLDPLGKSGVIQFEPWPGSSRDSIDITVSDISGNTSVKRFAWRYGSGLKVVMYGAYPNPFADTTVFVYQLTDLADNVDLKVYSRAGRLVRALSEQGVTGYREMTWDGRTSEGREIANGLYFLKISAKHGGKDASATFKLFKKKRK